MDEIAKSVNSRKGQGTIWVSRLEATTFGNGTHIKMSLAQISGIVLSVFRGSGGGEYYDYLYAAVVWMSPLPLLVSVVIVCVTADDCH